MKLPNKVTSYKESILSKLNILLDVIYDKDIALMELYFITKNKFLDISEFIDAIVILYALNKIEYDENLGELHYVS